MKEGELADWRSVGRQGIWRITEKGRERLDREQAELNILRQRATQIKPDSESRLPLDPTTEQKTHVQVQQQVEEIGLILGKYAKQEYRGDIYRYDVVWKDAEYLPRATHCFEVQHKGNLVEALAKLKHAFDIWGAKLVIVITDERDRLRATQLLNPYFTGVFHEIGSQTTVLTPDDVFDLHKALTLHEDVLKMFLSR